MEIQKIFSDYEGEERLYSVLMDEEELMLFSELQKEFNSKAAKALRKKFDLKNAEKVKEHWSDIPEYFQKHQVSIGRANNPYNNLGQKGNGFHGVIGGRTLNSRINVKGLMEEGLVPIDKSTEGGRYHKAIMKNRGGLTGDSSLIGENGIYETTARKGKRKFLKYLKTPEGKEMFGEDLKYLSRKKN